MGVKVPLDDYLKSRIVKRWLNNQDLTMELLLQPFKSSRISPETFKRVCAEAGHPVPDRAIRAQQTSLCTDKFRTQMAPIIPFKDGKLTRGDWAYGDRRKHTKKIIKTA